MTLPIYLYGWPLLRKLSEEISRDYPGLKELIADMFSSMYKADGVGLAAPQIGRNIRLIVVDARCMTEDDPSMEHFVKVFINAHITERGTDLETASEGCLSLPGIREDVIRPDWVQMEYFDEDFEYHNERFEGMAARVVQHEYDHLDGKLFIDHISPLRRKMISGKLSNLVKGKTNAEYKFVAVKK